MCVKNYKGIGAISIAVTSYIFCLLILFLLSFLFFLSICRFLTIVVVLTANLGMVSEGHQVVRADVARANMVRIDD